MRVEQAGQHACGEVARRSKPLSLCWREARECETCLNSSESIPFLHPLFCIVVDHHAQRRDLPSPHEAGDASYYGRKTPGRTQETSPPKPNKESENVNRNV